ncbi:hypothetical protein [Vibrio alginolyticus]|uniref:hypothetical protein n=1 Tax=Vibrio alginolyticus TaxID=663 RepID=UPI0015F745C9|nr:hypothetical protein [Vibrio alginolyticus]EJE4208720.1 hypothetical protein [Vibrio parahaemolyticus]
MNQNYENLLSQLHCNKGVIICCGAHFSSYELMGHQLVRGLLNNADSTSQRVVNLCTSESDCLLITPNCNHSTLNFSVSKFGDFKRYKYALRYCSRTSSDIITITKFDELSLEEMHDFRRMSETSICIADSATNDISAVIDSLETRFQNEDVSELVNFVTQLRAIVGTRKAYRAKGTGYTHDVLVVSEEMLFQLNKLQTVEQICDELRSYTSQLSRIEFEPLFVMQYPAA